LAKYLSRPTIVNARNNVHSHCKAALRRRYAPREANNEISQHESPGAGRSPLATWSAAASQIRCVPDQKKSRMMRKPEVQSEIRWREDPVIEQVASGSERQTTIWPRSANVMRILTWKLILGILVLVFAASAARANSVVNGSFETPTVPTGSFTNFVTGSTGITGWTVVGPEAWIVSGSYAALGFTFPAEDGKQWLDLTGDGTNSVEGVKQTFATTPGTMYNLSYFVGNQVNPGGIWGTTSAVNVLVDGV
jgi:hypothetical protein